MEFQNFFEQEWHKWEEPEKAKIKRFEELEKTKLEYKCKKAQMNYEKEIMLLDLKTALTLASRQWIIIQQVVLHHLNSRRNKSDGTK